MRCGNSQNMENGKGIISSLPSLYLSHSRHCCFPSFSNPNSFSLTFTIAFHHQQISIPRLFFFSSVSPSPFFIILFVSLRIWRRVSRLRRFGLRFKFSSRCSNFASLDAHVFLCAPHDLN